MTSSIAAPGYGIAGGTAASNSGDTKPNCVCQMARANASTSPSQSASPSLFA